MRRILIPLLLFAFSPPSEAMPKFDDDENLFENLNKTLIEIALSPVEDLTLQELSAALGKHIPEEHREAAMELLKYRTDRPMGALMADLQSFGTYSNQMAEEFSRGAMRALLDKSYLFPPNAKLRVGDHLCRCNQRDCASITNELYAVMGPEMSSFCRVDRLGHCMTSTRVINNTSKVDLFCGYSYATKKQTTYHDETEDYEHIHVCKSTKKYGKSCCKGAMCNDVPIPITDPLETALDEKVKDLDASLSLWKGVGVFLMIVTLPLLAALVVLVLLLCKCVDVEELKQRIIGCYSIPVKRMDETTPRINSRYSNNETEERGSNAGSESPLIPPSLTSEGTTITGGNSTNLSKSFHEMETSVGAGTTAGGSLMAQRTFSSFIRIGEPLGEGRFGKVFLGEWRGGEKIAVKKFTSALSQSFEQEVEILMSGMMSNSNILRWIGKDSIDRNGSEWEYWIMSEYHPNGSLYDYMETHSLSQHNLLMMMRGIANGISFLHSEIPANQMSGTSGKKGVAHRDLKTKNILVKSDLTCVIADFGMAVINETYGVKLPPGTKKSGTVRYLAPEVLVDDLSRVNDFEYYRASDMYSFALIMWECGRRTHATFGKIMIAEHSMDECLAYYTAVPREPTVADMREAVAEKELRPHIDEMWNKNPVFFEMSRIMRECWSTNPTARLTALNVKIVIDRLSSQLNLNLPTGYD